MRVCSVDGCGNPHKARGWCSMHYQRWQNYGDPEYAVRHLSRPGESAPCSIPGCSRVSVARSWCHLHYDRWRRSGDVRASQPPAGLKLTEFCTVCGAPTKCRQWCQRHYDKWRNNGDPSYERISPPPNTCSVMECDRDAVARQLCGRHYQRWALYGDPEADDRRDRCSACDHPHRLALDASILAGCTLTDAAERFGVSPSVLSRHKTGHLGYRTKPTRCMVCVHPHRTEIERDMAERDAMGRPRGSLVAIERAYGVPSVALNAHWNTGHARNEAQDAAHRLAAVTEWAQ